METQPTYLEQLKVNKSQLEYKITRFSESPEQAAHLTRLRAHLTDLNAEIDKHTPKALKPAAAPVPVEPVKPRSKKHANRK